MGVLYWQLNDVWQGPSWSSLNADGSWRLAHHLAAEFFRPVLVRWVNRSVGITRSCTWPHGSSARGQVRVLGSREVGVGAKGRHGMPDRPVLLLSASAPCLSGGLGLYRQATASRGHADGSAEGPGPAPAELLLQAGYTGRAWPRQPWLHPHMYTCLLPWLCSGVKAADGDTIQAHLTNDLPVGVTGGPHFASFRKICCPRSQPCRISQGIKAGWRSSCTAHGPIQCLAQAGWHALLGEQTNSPSSALGGFAHPAQSHPPPSRHPDC